LCQDAPQIFRAASFPECGPANELTDKAHGVTPAKLSAWYKTGYADWLRQQQHLENTIAQSDAALTRLARLSQETGADLPDLLAAFLASLLQKTLQDFDPARLNQLLAEKPAEIFRLISCLNGHIAVRSQHNHAEIARLRCQVQVAEKAQSTKKEPVPANNLFEAELFRKACGSPLEQLKQGLERRATEAKSKKPTFASKIAELESLDLGQFESI
jgi:ABC-type transporter Mla subunit MlaD